MGTIYYETAPMPQTDGTNIVVNGDGKLDLGTDITTKLGHQVQGTVSGDTATFTDTKIGSADWYLAKVFCEDSDRFVKSRSVSGNTLTVIFDSSVAGKKCVLQMFKEV